MRVGGVLVLVLLAVCGCGVRGYPTLQDQEQVVGNPVVPTQNGVLRGIRATYKGQTFDEFRGIPYAQPPVGTLRWERPRQPQSWEGERDAVKYGQPCTQTSTRESGEDCLYINVYVPHGVNTNKVQLPVMVWIHGGGMLQGSSNGYTSQDLALTGNVIVVMFNYRLSTLGGLSTSDANSPGNYMLWDARAALLWVRDNIANFGGDSSRVTLFGQSAGGTLTSHLATSPLTKGLIHRVITMSGGSAGPIGFQHQSRKMAEYLAEVEDCPVNNTKVLVQCLRGKEAESLDLSGYISSVAIGGRLPGWLPVKDGEIVVDMPKDAWEKGGADNIDFMIGRHEFDAASFVFLTSFGGKGDGFNIASDKTLLQLVLRFLLQTFAKGDPQELINVLITKYPDLDSAEVTPRTKAAVQITTDFAFAYATHLEAAAHARTAKSKNTFMYNWQYRPSFVHYEPWVQGSHNDELHFVFGEPFLSDMRKNTLGNFSTEDLKMKDNVMHYWANFAHTGDPSKGPHKVPTVWPQYNSETKKLLQFAPQIEVRKESPELLRRLDFWINEWPKISVPDETLLHTGRGEGATIPEELMMAFMRMMQ